ncbi:MAG TPA: Hpt domain-containing protein [Pyrinomonadaceae bacterium]|jgi:HPt (histidine-containing phosphotransfer) domain-containing protein
MNGRADIADGEGRGSRAPARACALDATVEADVTGEAVDSGVLLSLEEAQVEGEPDLIVELIDLYDEDTPRRLADIRGAFAARDLAALRRAAHGLKGSSASLGARRVALLCDKLERSSDGELHQAGDALLTRLESEFARARLAFAGERGRRLPGRGAAEITLVR